MRYRRIRIEGATYFFTAVTHKRRPLFQKPDVIAKLMTAIATVKTAHPFEIEAQVILPDHLHTIWSLPEGDSNYSMRWRQIKAAFTRSIANETGDEALPERRRSKRERGVWQPRFWEHTVRGDADFVAHVEYIHFNPVKHRLVMRPRDWPYSTFHDWVARGLYDINWAADAELEFAPSAIRE